MSKYKIFFAISSNMAKEKQLANIFLVPCYTIMISIESFTIDYPNVSHKTYTT